MGDVCEVGGGGFACLADLAAAMRAGLPHLAAQGAHCYRGSMKRLAFLVLLLASAACGGASPSSPPPATASPATASPLKAPGEAKVGDRTRCPVSGDEFVVAADSPQMEYGGKTYYFCCPGCINKFKADPQKFAAKPGA